MINEAPPSQSTSSNEIGTATRETPITQARETPARMGFDESTREMDVHVRDGLSPEQVDQRVAEKLEAPEVQRVLIKEFSPYSERINDHIRTLPELEVYQDQNLQEKVINDRPCLTTEVDPERTDAMGTTNAERMLTGRAPVDENGDALHLHHVGQKQSSPLAELKAEIHQKFDSVLHDKTIPTEVHGEGNNWHAERAAHWIARSSSNQT